MMKFWLSSRVIRLACARLILLLLAIFSTGSLSFGKPLRYFEMQQDLGDDTVFFVVATSLPDVIAQVEEDLSLPMGQRRFISGNVAGGDGGFNFDGVNWCTWHFVVNEWILTAVNVEHCDGISSGIGSNPAIVNGDTLYFCPWTSTVNREVQLSELYLPPLSGFGVSMFPNPAGETVTITADGLSNVSKLELLNLSGEVLLDLRNVQFPLLLDVHSFPGGCYLVEFSTDSGRVRKKLVVE